MAFFVELQKLMASYFIIPDIRRNNFFPYRCGHSLWSILCNHC